MVGNSSAASYYIDVFDGSVFNNLCEILFAFEIIGNTRFSVKPERLMNGRLIKIAVDNKRFSAAFAESLCKVDRNGSFSFSGNGGLNLIYFTFIVADVNKRIRNFCQVERHRVDVCGAEFFALLFDDRHKIFLAGYRFQSVFGRYLIGNHIHEQSI